MSAHTLFGRVGKVFRTCAKSHCLKLFTKLCSNQITLNYIVWIGRTKKVTDTPPPPFFTRLCYLFKHGQNAMRGTCIIK